MNWPQLPFPCATQVKDIKKSEVKLGLDYLFMQYYNFYVKVLLSVRNAALTR